MQDFALEAEAVAEQGVSLWCEGIAGSGCYKPAELYRRGFKGAKDVLCLFCLSQMLLLWFFLSLLL